MATTNEQTLAQKEETSQTPAESEESKEEVYTKAQLTELIQKEIGKVTAKHSKKIEVLQAELDAEKKKSLPDPEKTKLEIEERDKKIAERDAKLAALESKEKKRAALDAAKLTLPTDVSVNDLLDMMLGNDDESIAASIEKFKKMFPVSQSLGTQTTTGSSGQTKPSTPKEREAMIQAKINDPKTLDQEKLALGRELLQIQNELMRGNKTW